jgi:aspartate carbamoyltransferase catalytic subunit
VKHLLGIEGLSAEQFWMLLNNAKEMVEISQRDIKKVPALRGKTVVNMFFESSTRTRSSFEIAGKRLSADVVNFTSSSSSVGKGETLLDTALNLQAMTPDALVVRHSSSGAASFLAQRLKRTCVVNAGDGTHEHPTQALLDCLTILQRRSEEGQGLEGLKVAIVGDVIHSRVARSNVWAHLLLGNEVRLVGPSTFLPLEFEKEGTFKTKGISYPGRLKIYHDLRAGLEGADVVMCLRLQLERQEQQFVPSLEEYSREYGVSERLLAEYAPKSVVLHPGPVNRGIEVSSEVVDGPRSLVTRQVNNGVAVRMGVLFTLITGNAEAVRT